MTKTAFPKHCAILLVFCMALLGCATPPNAQGISDPLEPINRKIYAFNNVADKYVVKPIAKGYRIITPDFARAGVRNFFSNIGDFGNTINDVLQGQFSQAMNDGGRFFVNSTAGVLGLFDVASEIGLPKHYEDFGQTLGEWGLGSGPYIVLPLFGPSSLRDTAGFAVDSSVFSLLQQLETDQATAAMVLRAIDQRARYLNADRLVSQSSLDPYVFMRDSYLKRRQNLIRREANATASAPSASESLDDELRALEELDDLDETESDLQGLEQLDDLDELDALE